MLRLLLMGASQSAELHKVDTITRRFLDNVGDITWGKTENFARKIKDNNAREYYANYRLAAIPLDIAIAIGVNNEPTPATRGLGAKWRYTALDRTYQMVPIRSSSLGNPWALAYVAAHYHSSLWQGRTRTVLYTKSDAGDEGGYECTPIASCNEVSGPHHIMLVLVDQTASSRHAPVRLSGYPVDIPVYTGPTTDAEGNVETYDGVDYQKLFDMWWVKAEAQQRVGDCAAAYEHKCAFGAGGSACGIAYAMAAEMATGAPLGKGILPGPRGTKVNRVAGLWRMGGGAWWPLSRWKANTWDSSGNDEALTGFNSGILSPLMRFRLSWAAREDASDGERGKFTDPFQMGTPEGPTQATVTECSSFARLSFYIDLFNTEDQVYKLGTADTLASRVVAHGTALALSTSALLLERDISMAIWQGLNSELNAATNRSVAELLYTE